MDNPFDSFEKVIVSSAGKEMNYCPLLSPLYA